MSTRAVLFGGIGTIVETSELQREAFNQAFREAGLDWHWDRRTYRSMLARAGGAGRIADYARSRGLVEFGRDAAIALHERKTAHFHARLRQGGLPPRPGVARLLAECQDQQVLLGFASTTDQTTLGLLLEAVGIEPQTFAVITDRSDVNAPKPNGDVYRHCLETLGLSPLNALAIEDSESGLRAALDAGLRCVATPGANTLSQDYSGAAQVMRDLDQGFTLGQFFDARAA